MRIIAMIPARLGSQRLRQKNLQLLRGIPLISHAIRKAKESGLFTEIWVNSEADEIGKVALDEGVSFHKRPEKLANNQATSEDFIYEFLEKHHCDYIVQLHSIAPLLTIDDISSFVSEVKVNKADAILSVENIQIECAYHDKPINFKFSEKTNSQELDSIQRVTWSLTSWKREAYLEAYRRGKCATYAGNVSFHPIGRLAAHVIKDQSDLDYAEALFDFVHYGA